MKKIKFISGNFVSSSTWINSCFYMLKTYHDHFGKHKEYVWLKQNAYISKSIEEYTKDLLKEDFNILCASIYCWNNKFFTEVLKRVKEQRNDCVIIVGGPDVTARTDPDWFQKNPFVDYVIYDSGEKVFSNLLDSFVEPVDLRTIPNLIWLNDGKRIVNRNETLVREKEYAKISPWQHCKEYLQKDVDDVFLTLGKNIVIIIWERSRGCPYACSFCDFSSGLHNKVFRRTYDFKGDVDLIEGLNPFVEISMIDANVGIFDEDFDIIKYILEKEEKRPLKRFIDFSLISWVKQNTDANRDRFFRIVDYVIENNKTKKIKNLFGISQQDMNDVVLDNINRPSTQWDILKRLYLEKMQKAYPSRIWYRIEQIVGLPGQTRDLVNYNIRELVDLAPIMVEILPFQLLPYAPAYKQSYRDQFKIKSVTGFSIFHIKHGIEIFDLLSDRHQRDAAMKDILDNFGNADVLKGNFIEFAIESNSFDMKDYIYYHVKYRYYNKYRTHGNLKELLESEAIEKEILDLTEYNYRLFKEDLDKYNFILFIVIDDPKYLDINTETVLPRISK